MRFTFNQKKVMNYVGLAKVAYHNMWMKDHQLGYVSPDSPLDKIHIAKDFPDEDVKELILLHECGHIYFAHTSVDIKNEIKYIKKLFTELNRDFMTIMLYGGPMSFLNIAMDLEVNSKLLTIANVKQMNSFVTICTPESYDLPTLDNFREYYRPLIEKLPEGQLTGMSGMAVSMPNGQKSSSGKQNQNNSPSNNSGNSPNNSQNSNNSNGNGNGGNLPQLSDGLEDIMKGVSGFDSDLDEDVKKAIRKENYKSGDKQSHKGGEESDVNTEVDKSDEKEDGTDKDGNVDHKSSQKQGSGHSRCGSIQVVKNTSKEICNFLSKILQPSMIYLPDAFKHYNRGTRRNADGLLYNSMRRINRMDVKKLGVLIDVSSSMDTESIIKALSSLRDAMDVVSPDSLVVTWDTEKCEEFPITKIPKSVNAGGGTDMFKGLQYLVKKKHCNEVVIYSDFYTEVLPMTKLIQSDGVDVYNIRVAEKDFRLNSDGFGGNKDYIDYFKASKGTLIVKNIR